MGKRKRKNRNSTNKIIAAALLLLCVGLAGAFGTDNVDFNFDENWIEEEFAYTENYAENTTTSESTSSNSTENETTYNIQEIPEYTGEVYVEINNNIPYFDESEYTTEGFEKYSELDSLGRCGVAYANICEETMPPDGDERGDISSVKPTGWVQAKYDGSYLYNRCHLIGYQLSDEDDNELNLITGTRYFNVDGMLPFENMVADYINNVNEDGHVLYRVTPIYEGDNLLATGVEMEAYSIEDDGESVCYNVFVYNVQPGIVIDYATGESKEEV